MIFSLYWEHEITTKLNNSKINSIQLEYKVDAIFINSENGKIS